MFDQNPPCTLDKIWENPFQSKTFSQLDLESKVQGHSKKTKVYALGNKKHASQEKISRGFISSWCDADAHADTSKTICKPLPYPGST